MTEITARDKMNCALREVAMRMRVYPRRVLSRAMTQDEATREIDTMRAIAEDYAALADKDQGKLF